MCAHRPNAEGGEVSLQATDEARAFARRYREALLEIYAKSLGCKHLVWPSECRGRNGYPREQWCSGCIAGDALGIAAARPTEAA